MTGSEAGGPSSPSLDLRQRAEQRLKEKFTDFREVEQTAAPLIQNLLRELQLHQVELEMQNEALRQTADALEVSQSRYYDLYQMAPVGYLSLDQAGNIIEVNLLAATILGETAESLISQKLAKFVHPEDGDDFYLRRRELLRTGLLQAYEMRLRSENGPRPVLVEASLSRADSPDRQASRMVLIDITEEKRLWSQLLHSQKMEAMGVLAGGVAHHFNNALSVVKANCDLLLAATADDDPRKDSLLEIQQATERATKLTQKLMGVGRADDEATALFDLHRVVDRVLALLPSVLGANIVIKNDVCHEVLQVSAVPDQIELLLMNFVLNAQDAMPDGGELRIATCRKELPSESVSSDKALRQYAVVSVCDQGKGIPPELRERIFEQFFTTKEKSQGTGLGLTTAYAIAKRHSGFIEVESELGVGSCFSLFLPLLQAHPAVTTVEPSASPEKNQGTTILVVDDEPGVRKIVCRILAMEGYQVLAADSGPAAMEVFRSLSGGASLVLTDIVMPKMSGLQLASLLKTQVPDLPILFMSGYADDVLKSDLAPVGAKFLAKPFSRAALCARVREALES